MFFQWIVVFSTLEYIVCPIWSYYPLHYWDSQILCFLKIEVLWKPFREKFYQHHFSSIICSTYDCMLLFCDSHNVSKFSLLYLLWWSEILDVTTILWLHWETMNCFLKAITIRPNGASLVLSGKESIYQCRRRWLDLWIRKISPREGKCNPLQYSCLGNLMDKGTWQATTCGIAKALDLTWELKNNNNKTKYSYWWSSTSVIDHLFHSLACHKP